MFLFPVISTVFVAVGLLEILAFHSLWKPYTKMICWIPVRDAVLPEPSASTFNESFLLVVDPDEFRARSRISFTRRLGVVVRAPRPASSPSGTPTIRCGVCGVSLLLMPLVSFVTLVGIGAPFLATLLATIPLMTLWVIYAVMLVIALSRARGLILEIHASS